MASLLDKTNQILDEKNSKLLPENIKENVTILGVTGTLEKGIDTSDADATPNCIESGKTAYVNGEKITGNVLTINEGSYNPSNGVFHYFGENGVENATVSYDFHNDMLFRPNTYIELGIRYNEIQSAVPQLLPENIKKDITMFGVTGTLTSGSTDTPVKLFETIDEMNNDQTAKEGDMAVVYRDEVQNCKIDSQFSKCIFPETVVLPEAMTESISVGFKAVDSSAMLDCMGDFNNSNFMLDCYLENGDFRLMYESSDGVTYTRTSMSGNGVTISGNEVDFGTKIICRGSSYWNDNVGYFIQIGDTIFDGLYEYKNNARTDKIRFMDLSTATYNLSSYSVTISNLLPIEISLSKLKDIVPLGYNIFYITNNNELKMINSIYDFGGPVINSSNEVLGIISTYTYEIPVKMYTIDMNDYSLSEPTTLTQKSWTSGNYTYSYIEVNDLKSVPTTIDFNNLGYYTAYQCQCRLINTSTYGWSNKMDLYTYNNMYTLAKNQFNATPNDVLNKSFYSKDGAISGKLSDTTNISKDEVVSRVALWNKYNTEIVCPENMTDAFLQSTYDTFPLLNTSNVKTMNSMFSYSRNLISAPELDTSNVVTMKYMFNECGVMTSVPLYNTGNVQDMNCMFSNCYSLVEIPQFDTHNVIDMSGMFNMCSHLVTVPQLDTSSVTNMYNLFYSCPNLSDESLNNILAMCINATSYNGTKTLKELRVSSSYKDRIITLGNYQAFLDAGWTLGY